MNKNKRGSFVWRCQIFLMCSIFSLWLTACGGGASAGSTSAPLPFTGVPSLSLLAGAPGGLGFVDGAGTAARFRHPHGVAVDRDGNTYVADTENDAIRKITSAGVVTTLPNTVGWDSGAGGNKMFKPEGVAVDASGNVFVANTGNYTISKIAPDGTFSTVAGTSGAIGSDDAVGAAARFQNTTSIAVDGKGNVYATELDNGTIRKITPDGAVTTLAGTPGKIGSADGQGAAAQFAAPAGIAVDSDGNLYVADSLNNMIRKVTPDGAVTTLAGSAGNRGYVDGRGTAARFNAPDGVVVDHDGNVFVGDSGNHAIRKITPDGLVSTLVSDPSLVSGHPVSQGCSTTIQAYNGCAELPFDNQPNGIAIANNGSLIFADTSNNRILKIAANGAVSPFAGAAANTGSVDGIGSAARFYGPRGVAIDGSGNIVVADHVSNSIRKITPSGVVTTLTSTVTWPPSLEGIAIDGRGNLFVVDSATMSVRKVTPSGVATTLAQIGVPGSMIVHVNQPYGIAVDNNGNVYTSDSRSNTISKITLDGIVSILAGQAGNRGSDDGVGTTALFNQPHGIAVDESGNVYVADSGNDAIRKISPTGVVSTYVGSGINATVHGDNLVYPIGVAVTSSGLVITAENDVLVLRGW